MSVIPDYLKLRILLSFVNAAPDTCTVTGISRALRVDKQKISRAMMSMEKAGLLDRSNIRAPKLTEKGMEVGRYCIERIQIAQNHLLYEGVDLESAKHDSFIWALECSDELMRVVRANDTCYRVKRELRKIKRFTGDVLCQKLGDGSYQFPFIIYREQAKNGVSISMANEGFAHPCTLYVENGSGMIQLLAQPMTQRSSLDGRAVRGKVDKMQYFDFGRFVSAEFSNNVVSFPADSLRFINVKSGSGSILHGSVSLKMRCSCGLVHMPESTAIFTLLI